MSAPSSSPRLMVNVTCPREPSDAAWRRFGKLAAAALIRLVERDARDDLRDFDEAHVYCDKERAA